MKTIAFTVLSVVVFAASSSAFAEGKTRAEVYQELIEAQQNGLDYITDASYPDVNPAFAKQIEQRKAALAAKAAAAGRAASGNAAMDSVN
jgi:long-subunit fatty acid transport protein